MTELTRADALRAVAAHLAIYADVTDAAVEYIDTTYSIDELPDEEYSDVVDVLESEVAGIFKEIIEDLKVQAAEIEEG